MLRASLGFFGGYIFGCYGQTRALSVNQDTLPNNIVSISFLHAIMSQKSVRPWGHGQGDRRGSTKAYQSDAATSFGE